MLQMHIMARAKCGAQLLRDERHSIVFTWIWLLLSAEVHFNFDAEQAWSFRGFIP